MIKKFLEYFGIEKAKKELIPVLRYKVSFKDTSGSVFIDGTNIAFTRYFVGIIDDNINIHGLGVTVAIYPTDLIESVIMVS